MNFKIHQTELNTALQHLVRNTDNKFFNDIKMETKDGKLILQANNGEVSMEYRLKVDCDTNETVLINARKFTDIVSRLSDIITFDNGVIKSGKSKLKIDLKQYDNQPFFKKIEGDAITFSTENLKEFQTGIKNRLFACNITAQNILSGVCINKNEIATCNGNILAVYTLSEQLPFDTVVLSNKLCQEILKCFDNEPVQILITNNKIMLESDKISITGMLLQGQFPKYQQLIPKPKYHVTINKLAVIQAIELLKLIDEKSCTFNFSNDKLVIETGDSKTEIDIKNDVDMSICFSSNYMINCLKNIDSDVIDFGFNNSMSAALLSTDKEKTLLMPIVKK